ncbi:alkylated dna repair protein, putative [Acanthamoeba castellanii str. Neff]|uniref:Alkylated dna repair protein, putative n=1 Tax=Acanthamoeba castellanii (strain ATCC 30010 / Neff) TaxID=1257118 RepID=L8GHW1_ACACF|nr:alkylated dna repair protein, putative [Acanthamoeba castellanii str. Neff]ELR12449.1 alkylated dna repair protein, putative [Acanthamoeba castellanii str. Neff]
MDSAQVILCQGETKVVYKPDFMTPAESSALLALLCRDKDVWTRDKLRIYGKEVLSPRKVCAFGDAGTAYRYAGMDRASRAWPRELEAVRDKLEQLLGQRFNFALCNMYESGRDYIGWHADEERDIEPGSTIASVSLGDVRTFCLRPNARDSPDTSVDLADGSLLAMMGTTQATHKHCVPKRTSTKRADRVRINITFRLLRPRDAAS